MVKPLVAKSGNRALTNVVAAGDAALRLAGRHPFPSPALLMRGEGGLAAEFHALRLPVGPSQLCAHAGEITQS
jgi:hypothetical protein